MVSTLRRVRRAHLVAAVALVAAACGSGILPVADQVASAQPRHVVVVSDSILLGAQAPVSTQLSGSGWTVSFDGAVSRSTLAGAEVVRSHAAELTDTLLVGLGANDAGNPATFRQRVEAVLAAASTVPNVYWLTIREVRPYYGPANQVLRDAAARHPNLHLIDWNAASWGRSDLTAGDGLHLNGAGSALIAGLVAGTLNGSIAPASGAGSTVPPSAPAPVLPAPPAPVDTTVPAAPTVPADVPAPMPGAIDPASPAVVPIDRSSFVEPMGAPGRSASAAGPSERVAPAPGTSGWRTWVPLLLVVLIGLAFVARRVLVARSAPVLSASITRRELRRARVAGARHRHPGHPPTPRSVAADEPDPVLQS